MKIGLWVVQVLLAGLFGFAGVTKMFTPPAELAQQLTWVAAVPPWLVPSIGTAELLGALGLVLPSLLKIKPGLTPLAAAGLATVMVLATGLHVAQGEWSAVPVTLGLGCLAAFVVYGRTKLAPITRS